MLISPTTSAALASCCIQNKTELACLTRKTLNTSKPTYLHALLNPYTPSSLSAIIGYSSIYWLSHDSEQLWALVHSISLPPGTGIDFYFLFVAQTLYHPSKSCSKLIISSWLSRNWKVNWIF